MATADFFRYLCGVFEEVTINIITKEVALARVNESNDMTKHAKNNVFITAYSRLKLYKLLEQLQEKCCILILIR